MDTPWTMQCDLVIVGAGVAGLSAAVAAHEQGLHAVIVDKGQWHEGARTIPRYPNAATKIAQGGVAVTGLHDTELDTNLDDALALHVADTLDAGAGLCDEEAVTSIIEGGAAAVQKLIDLGGHFDATAEGPLKRTREGGHSVRRIIHAGGDATGAEVQRSLEVASAGTPCLQNARVTSIFTDADGVVGVGVRDPRGAGYIAAPCVLLATGGNGQLFNVTTSPEGVRGEGLSLALRAGARVADMEFTQFHPTVLFDSQRTGRRPLISEAVRGEGALLYDAAGTRFMVGIDPRLELAPRDIVARSIALHMRETGEECAWLDATHIDHFHERFPTVTAGCQKANIDPQIQRIPIAPAAHYQSGGIVTDAAGRTDVPGLYAAGECARTGLHGANRLASNSLLEGLVVGGRVPVLAAARCAERGAISSHTIEKAWRADTEVHQHDFPLGDTPVQRRRERRALQQLMSAYVGVTRDAVLLTQAADQLDSMYATLSRRMHDTVQLCRIITEAALLRTETRGGHTRLDYPTQDSAQCASRVFRLSPDGHIEHETCINPRP
ncbi:L-aspartate oxidase [Lawsonella clevelandensis]|uniref:L-aspartate oxidase n=2 Tax=Lawsonella clevelandensis TaxID=1528099 RepID=A0A0M4MCX7_9ACTN|nr:L-aspartate oxidase [Lawsonella clevelandensis]ALE19458.1 hypothetical protein AL705_07925 [Lawsonella clevelandensis]ALE35133.1 hypothetical protein IY73_07885 [Lawsonella clevelandensis]MDU7193673.1 L-aspartate oxidase [Lawsonella clevelandensis]